MAFNSGNILDIEYRKKIIQEINSDENIARKQESLKRYEIYHDRKEPYLINKLARMYDASTVKEMRILSSINLTKVITDNQSEIYVNDPLRSFMYASDDDIERLPLIYSDMKVDTSLTKANVYYNLMNQCTIQIIPKNGRLKMRVLAPHQYDVIPDPTSPEDGRVYITSQLDRDKLFNRAVQANNIVNTSNGSNQDVGDTDDWRGAAGIYAWWSDDYNFITDGKGYILNNKTYQRLEAIEVEEILNPIGKLPFVDVSGDKDNEYWVRYGNSTVDFDMDIALTISDTLDVNAMQGFAQAIISAMNAPSELKMGPRKVLFLKKDKNADPSAQPNFEFASPNPDLASSINLIKTLISLFLTSKKQDPATVNGDSASVKYASGLDRMLAQISKFEASKEDFDVFKWVEIEVYNIIRLWLNAFAGVTDGGLLDNYDGSISDDTELKES